MDLGLLEAAAPTLTKVGYVLDTPGAHFRSWLAGKGVGERASGEELLQAYGYDDPGIIASLSAEIIADPLNVIGIGGLTKVGKDVVKARKALLLAKVTEKAEDIKRATALAAGVEKYGYSTERLVQHTFNTGSEGLRRVLGIDVPLIGSLGELRAPAAAYKTAQPLFNLFKKSSLASKFIKQDTELEKIMQVHKVGLERLKETQGVDLARDMARLMRDTPELDPETLFSHIEAYGARGRYKELTEEIIEKYGAYPEFIPQNIRKAHRQAKLSNRKAEKLLANISESEHTLLQKYTEAMDTAIAEESKYIKSSNLADDPFNVLNYIQRVMTKEGRAVYETIVNNPKYASKLGPLMHAGFTIGRKKRGQNLFITELEGIMRETAEEITGESAEKIQFFTHDPRIAVQHRLTASGKVQARAWHTQKTAELFAIPFTEAKAGDVSLAEFFVNNRVQKFKGKTFSVMREPWKYTKARGKAIESVETNLRGMGMGKMAIPKEIAERATQTTRLFSNPESAIGDVERLIDKVSRVYRTYLTVPFAGFHIRNGASNVFLNWLGGVTNPKYYLDAAEAQVLMRKIDKQLLDPTKLTGRQLELFNKYRLASQYDVVGRGSISSEFGAAATVDKFRELGGKAPASLAEKKTGFLAKFEGFGYDITRRVEDNSRLAHFFSKMDDGFTEFEASLSVKKYLYDYQDLTEFERRWARKAILFYTFTRKNFPHMLEETLHQPGKMAAFFKATGATEFDPEAPSWLQAGFDVPSKTPGLRWIVSMGFPPEEVFQTLGIGETTGGVKTRMLSQLNPLIKAPIELATGVESFSGRRLQADESGITAKRLLEWSPVSRLAKSVEKAIEASGEKTRGQKIAKGSQALLGAAFVRGIEENKAELQNIRDAMEKELSGIAKTGGAFRFDVTTPSREASPEVRRKVLRLNRELKRTTQRLSTLRK